MASGGRAPRSRTTRVAARRSSAGSTASRYGRPPRSGVAVEARKTVMAFTSRWLTIVGGAHQPKPLLTRTAAGGQERPACSSRTHRQGSAPHQDAVPFFGRPFPTIADAICDRYNFLSFEETCAALCDRGLPEN